MPQMTRPAALPHPPEPDWKHRLAEIDAAARQREARQLDAVIDTALQVLDEPIPWDSLYGHAGAFGMEFNFDDL